MRIFYKTRRALASALFYAALAFVFLLGTFSCASARSPQDNELPQAQELSQAQEAAGENSLQDQKLSQDFDGAAFFEPERFEELPQGQSAATFKTSKPKAAIYLNGEYHGLTPLKAAGLVPGRYFIQIKKKGFKAVNIAIQVKDGVSDYYYIEMEAEDQPAAENRMQAQESAGSSNEELSQDQNAAPAFGQQVIQTQSQEVPEL